jgi:hypothetical protein
MLLEAVQGKKSSQKKGQEAEESNTQKACACAKRCSKIPRTESTCEKN